MRNIIFIAFILSTNLNAQNMQTNLPVWEQQFDTILNQFGHRNWILITDKAFPKQSAAGMRYIDTNEGLTSVLQKVMFKISQSEHVKPIIYTDKELEFISEKQAKGIGKLRKEMATIMKKQPVNTLLHDDVFKKLDESADLFEILVLKTNCTIPYSSVFIFLDCAYWSDDKEKTLRKAME